MTQNVKAEDVCWQKIKILADALDLIITIDAGKKTLKKIARKAIKRLPEKVKDNK
jgi:hypothetical protein